MSTGNRIESRRKRRGLTRAELANLLNAEGLKVNRLQVWRIETGAVRLPIDQAKTWAKVLKMPAAELLA